MAVVLRSGIVGLVQGVRKYFEDYGVTAAVHLGWAEAPKQNNQGPGGANRVVFQPSDPNGGGGKVIPVTKGPGPRPIVQNGQLVGTARALADHEVQFTCHIWAGPTSPPNEELQIEQTLELHRRVVQALHSVGQADLANGNINWVAPGTKQYGKAISFAFTFKTPILDNIQEVVFPTANPIQTEPKHDNDPD